MFVPYDQETDKGGWVINELEPYPAYKDSGVPWLGDVPGTWKLLSLKFISTRIPNGSTLPTDAPEFYVDDVGAVDQSDDAAEGNSKSSAEESA